MLILKTLGNGVTKIDDGKYRVDFSATETANLEPKDYVYDMRFTIGSVVGTPLYGYLNIMETVFE